MELPGRRVNPLLQIVLALSSQGTKRRWYPDNSTAGTWHERVQAGRRLVLRMIREAPTLVGSRWRGICDTSQTQAAGSSGRAQGCLRPAI